MIPRPEPAMEKIPGSWEVSNYYILRLNLV